MRCGMKFRIIQLGVRLAGFGSCSNIWSQFHVTIMPSTGLMTTTTEGMLQLALIKWGIQNGGQQDNSHSWLEILEVNAINLQAWAWKVPAKAYVKFLKELTVEMVENKLDNFGNKVITVSPVLYIGQGVKERIMSQVLANVLWKVWQKQLGTSEAEILEGSLWCLWI